MHIDRKKLPRKASKPQRTEASREESRQALQSFLGPSMPIPTELRELVEWGRDQDKRMKLG